MLQKLKLKFIFSSPIQNLIPTIAVVFLFKNPDLTPHPYMLYGVTLAGLFGLRNTLWSLLLLTLAGGWFRYQSLVDPIIHPVWILKNSILPVTFFMLSALIGTLRDGLNLRLSLAEEKLDELRILQQKMETAFTQTRKRNTQLEEELAREFRRTLDALSMNRMNTHRDWLKALGRLIDAESLVLYKFDDLKNLKFVESVGADFQDFPKIIDLAHIQKLEAGQTVMTQKNNKIHLWAPILTLSGQWRGLIEVLSPNFLTIHQETFRILEEAGRCAEKRI